MLYLGLVGDWYQHDQPEQLQPLGFDGVVVGRHHPAGGPQSLPPPGRVSLPLTVFHLTLSGRQCGPAGGTTEYQEAIRVANDLARKLAQGKMPPGVVNAVHSSMKGNIVVQ